MNDNNRIAVNSIIVFVRLVITSLIGIFSSRIVLDALGASDYGLYNVVGGIVAILNVFNGAMLSTTYRFIASELGKVDNSRLNKVFNTSFLIHASFAVLILILGLTLGEWYINNYLKVADGKLTDARFVFYISLIITAISTLLIPYQGLITAFEKFTVLALRDVVTKIVFLVALALFLYSDSNRLRLYALIQLGYYLLYNGGFLVYCKYRFKKESHFALKWEPQLIKDMFSFAFWTLFGAVAAMGRTQGSVLLINFFFGSIVNAAYAIAAQVDGFVQTFARSLNSAAVPQITKSFSGGKESRSITLASYISKYTFILMSLIAFPILMETEFLLGIWLKDVPEGAGIFCRLMILGGLLGTLGEGIPALVNATGNIKVYQIVYHSFTLLGLLFAWILFSLGYNQYTIQVVYCIIYALSTVLRLFLLKRLYGFDVKKLISISYIRIAYIMVPLLLYFLLCRSISTCIGHFVGLICAELFVIFTVAMVGFEKKERIAIRQLIYSIK